MKLFEDCILPPFHAERHISKRVLYFKQGRCLKDSVYGKFPKKTQNPKTNKTISGKSKYTNQDKSRFCRKHISPRLCFEKSCCWVLGGMLCVDSILDLLKVVGKTCSPNGGEKWVESVKKTPTKQTKATSIDVLRGLLHQYQSWWLPWEPTTLIFRGHYRYLGA